MPVINKPTEEIKEEIAIRMEVNPQGCRRVGALGFIELEDVWGDEAVIINTARVSSTNRRVNGVADFSDQERALLYHLLKEEHGTPFETVVFRYRFIAPIFVLRQWVKHRVSTWNEYSLRYRKPISVAYVPDQDARTVQGFEVMDEDALVEYEKLVEQLMEWYERQYSRACERIDQAREQGEIPPKETRRDPYRGRARELFRNTLPLATYSDVYWTVNFRSLMNFFKLRRKQDAQYEMRQYADAAYELFAHERPLLAQTMEQVFEEREKAASS